MAEEYTSVWDVIDSFEASFQDKRIIPHELEWVWLRKAVARYSTELDPIALDGGEECFTTQLSQYCIDTLAAFMKQSYMEREVSKVNKRISIVGKDLSIDGNNGSKTAARNELEYDESKSERMIFKQLPTAYV